MSLQKQLVHLNMSGGLQKKDDSFLVIPSKLAVADDVEFDDLSTVKTRGGQASVSLASDVALFGVGRAERLFAHQGRAYIESRGAAIGGGLTGGVQRVAAGGGTYPVFGPRTSGDFTNPFRYRRAGAVTSRVTSIDRKGTAYGAGVPFYDGSFDHAVVDGKSYFAVETRDTAGSGRQTIRVIVVDESSGYKFIDVLLVDGTNVLVKPRVVVSPGKSVYIYFASFVSGSANFSVKVVSVSTSVGAVNTVVTGAGTGGTVEGTNNDAALFDAAFSADGSRLGLALRDSTAAGTTLRLYSLSPSDGYTISASSFVTASARITTLTCLVSYDGSKYRVHGFYGINTNVAKAGYYDIGVGSSLEATVGTGPVGSTVGRIAAYENSTTQILLAFDTVTTPGALPSSLLRLASFAHDYTTLTECASTTPWVIAGRIASVQSRLYMPMALISNTNQGTVFVVDMSDAFGNLGVAGALGAPFQVLARLEYGESALDVNRWKYTTRVPSLSVVGGTLSTCFLKYETDLRLVGTANETPYALGRVVLDPQSQLGDAEINGMTVLAGACPYMFDGSYMTEENFHHAPEIDTGVALGATGYELPNVAGDYVVCFTMAWQDAQGNWHESAPSNERTFTVGANRFIPTTAVVLPPTQKPNARVLMYRTPLLGTNTSLYVATRFDGTFVTSDTDLVSGEQLYTAGNVLPNTPAPSCRHVSVFQKRLVLSGCGDGSRVHWSKQTTPGYGVEFSSGDPSHQTTVPADKGRVVATEEMDDRLVVLCENGVGIISGTGPAPTGLAGQYSDFSSIITETGCSWDSPKSVARGPEGVWFRSPFGIRLVSRSGSLARNQDGKQAGAEVDALVSGTIVAVAGDARQQIRFFQSSGTCLVWDYQWQQWTRFTDMTSVDAVYADDRFYHLSNYSTTIPLLRYTSAEYDDTSSAGVAGTVLSGVIETPWLSFAGIQGFQRVYRLMMLGKDAGATGEAHAITLSVYKDFDEWVPVETATMTVSTSSNGQIQVQHHFATQKCEAMKLRVAFAPAQASEARLRLTDLTLQVGVKSGYNKVPSSQRF